MSTLAFVGVGRMGSRMAGRLVEAGHEVRVFDPDPAAVAPLAEAGAVAASNPAEAAKGAEAVLLSLPSPAVLRAVILGPDGVLAAEGVGTVVDHSTVDPSTTREVAQACEERAVRFLDAPVSGGVAGAESGSLLLMVGGTRDDLDAVRPVLEVLAARIVHCGPVGSGQLTKLSHNLLTAVHTVAAGEVLTAAVHAGADLAVLTEVLGGGLAGSKMLDYFGRTLFTDERPANFALDLMHKDISLCLSEFAGTPMPLGQQVLQTYNVARAKGLGGKDSTSVAELHEDLLGVRLRHADTTQHKEENK